MKIKKDLSCFGKGYTEYIEEGCNRIFYSNENCP